MPITVTQPEVAGRHASPLSAPALSQSSGLWIPSQPERPCLVIEQLAGDTISSSPPRRTLIARHRPCNHRGMIRGARAIFFPRAHHPGNSRGSPEAFFALLKGRAAETLRALYTAERELSHPIREAYVENEVILSIRRARKNGIAIGCGARQCNFRLWGTEKE